MTQAEIKEIIAAHPDAKLYALISHTGSKQPYYSMGLHLSNEAEVLECCEVIKRYKCGLISEFAMEAHYWKKGHERVTISQDQKAVIFTNKWIDVDQL